MIPRNQPQPAFDVTPARALIDDRLRVAVSGLPQNAPVTVRAKLLDARGEPWTSQATFVTNPSGAIDLAAQPPIEGSYSGVDGEGLVTSLTYAGEGPSRPFDSTSIRPLLLSLTADVSGREMAATQVQRRYVADDVRVMEYREPDRSGLLFEPATSERRPGVIVMGGSSGGLLFAAQTAALLASRGFVSLALAYFDRAELPPRLIGIPLEYFAGVIDWFSTLPTVRPRGIGVMGISRGAELSLLLGSRYPAIRTVVAYSPSHVVWNGLRGDRPVDTAAWIVSGRAIPFSSLMAPRLNAIRADVFRASPVELTPLFEAALDGPIPPDTLIPVEQINGPVLLVSGEDDRMWPSTRMGEQMMARLAAHRHPFRSRHLHYPGAGHLLRSPGVAAERFVQTLRVGLNGCLDNYNEYFEAARFGEREYPEIVRDFLVRKYAGIRFDLIIAFQSPALSFVVQYGRELFPGTPVFFVAGKALETENSSPDPSFAGVRYKVDLRPTLEVARSLQPSLKRIYVISGAAAFDQNYEQGARDQFREFGDRLDFTYLSGLPIVELRERVAHLPADSAVYLMMITADREGNKFARDDVASMISAASTAPVYSGFGIFMDHGIVGGNLLSIDQVVQQATPLPLRMLRGEPASSVGVSELNPNVLAFDWRQLSRWGIAEARLPAGSTVLFREPGVWEQHRFAAMTALAVVLVQAALIAGLVIQRNRRRRAETTARNLAGRLLTAQETERRRIARDLHDDLSQSMAVVSFELGNLMAKQGAPQDADLRKALASVERRSDEIAKTLRTLSHNLHPPVLQHLGLAAALTSYCRELHAHGVMTVRCQVPNHLEPVSKEIALCLYRIAQEAVQNAWKYSHARGVNVTLARRERTLDLIVTDDGRGFDLAAIREDGRGLGLVSIEERTRLVNGTVSIRTAPGAGVSVHVRVPMAEDTSRDAAALIPRVSRRSGETG